MATIELSTKIGWYEFIKVSSATTHIIYVGENSLYVPEEGITVDDFFAAVEAGQAYQLVRLVDVEKAVEDITSYKTRNEYTQAQYDAALAATVVSSRKLVQIKEVQ